MTDRNKTFENKYINLLLEESALKGHQREQRYPDRRFFGYFCSYWPEELTLAAGLEPLRILPASPHETPPGLPAYCCSLARGGLALAQGKHKDLTGVGLAQTCDTMQCLGGIWGATPDTAPALVMVPPVLLSAPGAERYYRAELESTMTRLGELAGTRPGSKDLKRSLELTEHIRRLAAELDEMRPQLPSPLVSALLRAGQVMPRDEYAIALAGALSFLAELSESTGERKPVLVSGAVLETDSLFTMLEELGGRVVADDTCTGYRHYSGPATGSNNIEPLAAMVQRYTAMAPCPCRSTGLEDRTDYLEQLARNRQAAGAVLVIRKYCEPHAWDAVPAVSRLKAGGIPTLVLELEGSDVGGQERTRLQAFLESL